MSEQSIEAKNLIIEADKFITLKEDAIELCTLLMIKFDITLQDFIDTLNKVKKE